MPRQRVALTPELTDLIRQSRRRLRLTQAHAAAIVGMSQTWWRRIENGNQPRGEVEARTLASMLGMLGILPAELRAIGQEDAAAAVEVCDMSNKNLRALFEGLTPDEMNAVVAFIETMRNVSADRRKAAEGGDS